MIAGEGFQTEDCVRSSIVCGVSIIFGCPVPNSFGGNDPMNCSNSMLRNFFLDYSDLGVKEYDFMDLF